jgi:glycolate oxidase iron-sulfur subunit
MPRSSAPDLVVAFHSPCSLQHGQRAPPAEDLLSACGFESEIAGALVLQLGQDYNILQPEIAARFATKVANIEAAPGVIAAGTSAASCRSRPAPPSRCCTRSS